LGPFHKTHPPNPKIFNDKMTVEYLSHPEFSS
jgi:hypothetical protein